MSDDVRIETPPVGSEEISLPSKGKFYGGAVPDGKVMIRPWGTDEEKLLLTARKNREDVVDRVLNACLLTRTQPLDQYLVGDKAFMLLALRCITLWPEYDFPMQCQKCGKTSKHKVDLKRDLKVKELTDDDAEQFKVKLPVCGKELTLRRLKGTDETAIRKFSKQRQSINASDVDNGDPSYLYTLALTIVAIDGDAVDHGKAQKFLERPPLHGRDSLLLQQAIDANDCGVDLSMSVACPACGFETVAEVPLTDEFFRPRSHPGG